MGFPENVLAKDERVVKSLHPHWLTVFLPTVFGIIVLGLGIFLLTITRNDNTGMILNWVIIGVGIILLIAFVVVPYLRWRTTHYVVTSHRVMVRKGILAKNGKDIALSKITDVSFSQTFWDRIISAGTLNVESAGDSPDESFNNIPHSNDVQQLINHLVEEDQNRRAGQAFGNRPQEYQGDRQPTAQYQQDPQDEPPGGWQSTH